jgi:CRP-like cAMP-binding protein
LKISYERGNTIYTDGEFSDYIYLIDSGSIKLYADNGLVFGSYRGGDTLGDNDVLVESRRNGTAKSYE